MEMPDQKTFEKLCQEHQRYCKINNLSPATLKTYQNACIYFGRFIGENYLCKDITQQVIDSYKLFLLDSSVSAVSVNTYLRNVSPALKFGFERGYIKEHLNFKRVKAQERFKDIYTDSELRVLLKKPNVKKNGFAEYRNWCIINTLIATGIRANELRNLKIVNVDFENDLIKLQVTKNKKARMIPMSTALKSVLTEYLSLRNGEQDDYLFPNIYGEMMPRTTLQISITNYCKKRGIEKYALTYSRIIGYGRPSYANVYVKPNDTNKKEDDELTHDQFNKMMDTYLATLANKQPEAWSADARKWAESNGIIKGNDTGKKEYKNFCTREMMVEFLYRMSKSK